MLNSKITSNNCWVEEGQRKYPKRKHSEKNRALQNVKKDKTTKKIS